MCLLLVLGRRTDLSTGQGDKSKMPKRVGSIFELKKDRELDGSISSGRLPERVVIDTPAVNSGALVTQH